MELANMAVLRLPLTLVLRHKFELGCEATKSIQRRG